MENLEQNLIGYHLPGSGNPENPLKPRVLNEVSEVLQILGEGSDGSLQISPEVLNFEIVKVGFRKKLYATLQNPSNCSFNVTFRLVEPNDNPFACGGLEENFQLDVKETILAGNSKFEIGVTFQPKQIKEFCL
jgi:hypothetical protein